MKSLAHNKGVLVDEPEYFGPRCFSDEAIRAFPELSTELARGAELLHVQMGTLASAGRAAIQRDDIAFLHRLFAFHPGRPISFAFAPRDRQRSGNVIPYATRFRAIAHRAKVWQSLPPNIRDAIQRTI